MWIWGPEVFEHDRVPYFAIVGEEGRAVGEVVVVVVVERVVQAVVSRAGSYSKRSRLAAGWVGDKWRASWPREMLSSNLFAKMLHNSPSPSPVQSSPVATTVV